MAKKKKKQEKEKSSKIKAIDFEIKLRIAVKADFLILDKYLEGGKKKWKLRFGLPYWLINSKGVIENDPYIIDEHTNTSDFGDFLQQKRVLIPIKRFDYWKEIKNKLKKHTALKIKKLGKTL